MKIVVLTCAACLLGPAAAHAQAAEGTYPGTLSCDARPDARAVRAPVTVEIERGRAHYTVRTDGGVETGGGAMTGRQLALTGRGNGYEVRYAGEVSGTGGILTGFRTAKGSRRPCQMLLGSGRS